MFLKLLACAAKPHLQLQLVVRTKNVNDLVFVHLLHVFASRLEVLARVEVFRMFVEILTDSGSHGETAVRVDVDLANSGLGSFAELFFRNTDGIRELATVGVDGVHFVLRNRRRTVENDGEARELLFDGVEHVECQRRRNELASLRVAVHCSGLNL